MDLPRVAESLPFAGECIMFSLIWFALSARIQRALDVLIPLDIKQIHLYRFTASQIPHCTEHGR